MFLCALENAEAGVALCASRVDDLIQREHHCLFGTAEGPERVCCTFGDEWPDLAVVHQARAEQFRPPPIPFLKEPAFLEVFARDAVVTAAVRGRNMPHDVLLPSVAMQVVHVILKGLVYWAHFGVPRRALVGRGSRSIHFPEGWKQDERERLRAISWWRSQCDA